MIATAIVTEIEIVIVIVIVIERTTIDRTAAAAETIHLRRPPATVTTIVTVTVTAIAIAIETEVSPRFQSCFPAKKMNRQACEVENRRAAILTFSHSNHKESRVFHRVYTLLSTQQQHQQHF